MRVLHINTCAKTGSTGKIVYSLHTRLKKYNNSSMICYGRGKLYPEEKDLVKITSKIGNVVHATLTRLSGYTNIFSNNGTRRLIREISKFKPDVVHLFNLHGYYLNEVKLFDY